MAWNVIPCHRWKLYSGWSNATSASMIVAYKKVVPATEACQAIIVTQPVIYERNLEQEGGARTATLNPAYCQLTYNLKDVKYWGMVTLPIIPAS